MLGLTTGVVVPQQPEAEKREAYQADITYATNNELGFDYLRDNMKSDLAQMTQRGHNYAIVDEVDSHPRGRGAHAAHHLGPLAGPLGPLHPAVDELIPALPETGYTVDEKTRNVTFTDEGNDVLEETLREAGLLPETQSLYDPESHDPGAPRQPGAAGAQAVPEGQGLHRPRRQGGADRRVHRPHDDRPPPVGRPPPGHRGQGRRRRSSPRTSRSPPSPSRTTSASTTSSPG